MRSPVNNYLEKPSRGGLEVERWSDNGTDSASVGLNPAWVWYIDRSEVETLCRNSNCRAPGAKAFTIWQQLHPSDHRL